MGAGSVKTVNFGYNQRILYTLESVMKTDNDESDSHT